jgi:hemolysin-activating ACP:hemolysin acyltransferase
MIDAAQMEETVIPASNISNKMGLIADVICLMLDSQVYLVDTLYDIKKNLVAPIFKDQALVMVRDEKIVAYCSWAFLSDEAQAKYIKDSNSLDITDWNSGSNIWLVDVVCPYGDSVKLLGYTKRLAKIFGFNGNRIKYKLYKDAKTFKIGEVKL